MILSTTFSHLSLLVPRPSLQLPPTAFIPAVASAWKALSHLPIHLMAGFCLSFEDPLNIIPFNSLLIFPGRE